jgi:hypothetical protein
LLKALLRNMATKRTHVHSTYTTDVIYVLLHKHLYLTLAEGLKFDFVGLALVLQRHSEIVIEVIVFRRCGPYRRYQSILMLASV